MVVKWLFPFEEINLDGIRAHVRKELNKLGKMRFEEKKVLVIFIGGFLLWITVGTILGLAVVSVAIAIVLFMTRTISWKDAERGIPWGIIFLYGGAISLGKALTESGAADFLGVAAVNVVGSHPYLVILVLVVLTLVLTEVMSNAAAVGVLLPIAITALVAIGIKGDVVMYIVAIPAGLAFMLPISTPGNAIVYSSGYLRLSDLLRAGIWLSLIGVIVVMTVGLGCWKLMGLF